MSGNRYNALTAGPEDGPLVLMLHGWPEFADSWTSQLVGLATLGYQAVAVDQRGYSPEVRPLAVGDYGIEVLAQDAMGFAEAFTSDKFHLVGQDWGGAVAWKLAELAPEKLHSLAVLSCPHPEALRVEALLDRDQYERLDYMRFFREQTGTPEKLLLSRHAHRLKALYGSRMPEEQVHRNVARLTEPGVLTATLNWYRAMRPDVSIEVGPVTPRVLHVWGTEDRALGRAAVDRSVHYVRGAYRLEVIEGQGHWLSTEIPERITALLREHLDSPEFRSDDAHTPMATAAPRCEFYG
ncbi:alpha/beta hydrolase [Streptomyces sp. NPDC006872]|uniref:alpha/beta fold hydrolase n=1 Tax=Streptomyces sp. NPDC006872 TaxID=3155720 RepID=UPI0034014DAD